MFDQHTNWIIEFVEKRKYFIRENKYIPPSIAIASMLNDDGRIPLVLVVGGANLLNSQEVPKLLTRNSTFSALGPCQHLLNTFENPTKLNQFVSRLKLGAPPTFQHARCIVSEPIWARNNRRFECICMANEEDNFSILFLTKKREFIRIYMEKVILMNTHVISTSRKYINYKMWRGSTWKVPLRRASSRPTANSSIYKYSVVLKCKKRQKKNENEFSSIGRVCDAQRP